MRISRLFFAAVAAAGIAAAQTQYITARVDGIAGSSTLQGFVGQCEAQSWAFGATDPASTNMPWSLTGKTQISALVLTRSLDACSPKLFSHATAGQHINTVVLTQSQPTQGGLRPLMVVTLYDAAVSSYQIGGNAGDKASPPTESVSFVFMKIQFEYLTYRNDGTQGGSIVVSYDLSKGY